MSEPKCPTEQQLQQLLDERLSVPDADSIVRHLDGCARCRKALDHLAGVSKSWPALAGKLRGEGAPSGPGLQRVLAELREGGEEARTQGIDASTPAEVPKRIAGYEIRGLIGEGGMGRVYLGFDPVLQRVVAIKVLAPGFAASGPARLRFLREARSAAAVRHEHIVGIHGVENPDGVPCIVMEYIKGKSLQDRIDEDGPLGLREVLRIGLQTAEGLAAAHAQGLVHRDIKPANILLENGIERVKITDFGLARAMDDASLTRSGVIAGTPMYMSPEQANGEAMDHRADLFSLGSVLYTACTGHPPFRASNTMAVLKRVCEEQPRPMRKINPDIPEWFCEIVAKLQAKKPADRYPSAEAVAEELRTHLAHLQRGNPAWEPAPRSRRQRGRFRRAVPVALVILAGLLVVLFWLRLRFATVGETVAVKPSPAPALTSAPGALDLLVGYWRHELVVERTGPRRQEAHVSGKTTVDRVAGGKVVRMFSVDDADNRESLQVMELLSNREGFRSWYYDSTGVAEPPASGVWDPLSRTLTWRGKAGDGSRTETQMRFAGDDRIDMEATHRDDKGEVLRKVRGTFTRRFQGGGAPRPPSRNPDVPDEARRLFGRIEGQWKATGTLKQELQPAREVRASVSAWEALGGWFVEGEEKAPGGPDTYWLLGHDRKTKGYRLWEFSATGDRSEFRGEWNEEKRTMKWTSAEKESPGEGKWEFTGDDTWAVEEKLKDREGNVVLDLKETRKRTQR